MDNNKITRLEVIENGKRKYVKWNGQFEFSLQDDFRTLKIFVKKRKKEKK